MLDSKELKFILIITYGRSGSTLLQGLLNTIPETCIRGENNNALVHLESFYNSITKSKEMCFNPKKTDTKDPWYGIDIIDTEKILNNIRNIVVHELLNLPEGTRIAGFKEIRYGRHYFKEYENLKQYILFLKTLFPNLRIIFNYRNKRNALKSGWWPEVANAEKIINNIEEKMRAAYKDFFHIAYWLDYDKYVKDHSLLKELFDFLEEPYDESLVRKTIGKRHSI